MDEITQKPPTSPSPPTQRNDSITGSPKNPNPKQYHATVDDISVSSIYSSSSSASVKSTKSTPQNDTTPSTERFVNGEIVRTGGLTLESRDLSQIEAEAEEVAFNHGRSVKMTKEKTGRVRRVKRYVLRFFKRLRGSR
jgi:hypothetical protein